MPPKNNSRKNNNIKIPACSQTRLASLNTGLKSVRPKKPSTPRTGTSTAARPTSTPGTKQKQATLSGFGFAAKPKTPITPATAEEEAGGGDRKRRRISGDGSQYDPITFDGEAAPVAREIKEIRETQFAGITQSPGWESDSDLEEVVPTVPERGARPISQRGASVGELTPRFMPAGNGNGKEKNERKSRIMAPRFAPPPRPPLARRKALSSAIKGAEAEDLKRVEEEEEEEEGGEEEDEEGGGGGEASTVSQTLKKPLSTAQVIDLCSSPPERQQREEDAGGEKKGGGAVSTHWGPSPAPEEDIQAKDWAIVQTNGTPRPSQESQTAPALVREDSRDLMPPPPATPKRKRRTLSAEIPCSQSSTQSPLRTQQTQTQPSLSSQSRTAVGMGIASSLNKTPLKRAIEAAGLSVVKIKSSQWWENVDTQDNISDTASESEAEEQTRSGAMARDQARHWQRSQIPGTQDDSDSAPLSPVPPRSPRARTQGAGTRDGASASADPTTVPRVTPRQPFFASPQQQAHLEGWLEHVESAFPAFRSHRPQAQDGSIGRSTAQRESVMEAAQATSPSATPRGSRIEQHPQFCDADADDDAGMTFDLGTPCGRVSTPKHSLPPAFPPRTPSPLLQGQGQSPVPLHRIREHSPSPYRRSSSQGTTAFQSPSTVRQMAPSSLTSFTISPQQQLQQQHQQSGRRWPTESQFSSVQETPLKKGINHGNPPSQAEDIILDTPTKHPNHYNNGDDDNNGNSERLQRVLGDGDGDHNGDDDDDATQSQDGDGDEPSLDFHPVKTQQFPFSMFVRVSSAPSSPPTPSTPTATAAAAACERVLEYHDEHGGDEDHRLPPPLPEAMAATGSQGDGGGNGDEPVLLTTSQLLPETLMESFPMPPPLTQSSTASKSGGFDEEEDDGTTR